MYADSDEENSQEGQERQGQSEPNVSGEAEAADSADGEKGAHRSLLGGMSPQVSTRPAGDHDADSVGDRVPEPMDEDPRSVRETVLERLPAELREPPPSAPIPCIAENVKKWMNLKEGGLQLAAAIQQRRDFCNPYMMNMMIEYNQLDEYGSCYPKDLWDPKGIPPEDFAKALEKELIETQKRRQQEQRAKGKIDFASGGVEKSDMAPSALSSGPASAVSAAAAAAVAKAKVKAAALSKAQPPANKPKRASKWDSGANPLMK